MSLNVQPISFGMMTLRQTGSNQNQPAFGYSNELKTLFKKGLLPTVKVDVMGNKLTKKNVTLDHIIPKSRGGTNELNNLQILTVFENLAKRDMTQEEWNNFKKETKTHSDYFIENFVKEE